MTRFREFCAVRDAADLPDRMLSNNGSIDERGAFRSVALDFYGIRGEKDGYATR